jgi:hypothetical protein
MAAPYLVLDDFLPADLALAMRADIEAHFSDPVRHRAESHQVWNYWFVPGLYTYLRTSPNKIIHPDRVTQFIDGLRGWSARSLGLDRIDWPHLSLYVPGCHQGIHNDSANGRVAFVYSLTKDQRKTVGGETLVFHEGDAFRRHLRQPQAGSGFYAPIEPRFNRLVLFDDRMLHAVQKVEGSMDPLEGRFVLHGHLSEGSVFLDGALAGETVMTRISDLVGKFYADHPGVFERFHGPLSLRLVIAADGSVSSTQVLLDRVVHIERDESFAPLLSDLRNRLRQTVFPAAERETVVILPILFGGVLPAR